MIIEIENESKPAVVAVAALSDVLPRLEALVSPIQGSMKEVQGSQRNPFQMLVQKARWNMPDNPQQSTNFFSGSYRPPPPHVPPELVVNFDFSAVPPERDPHEEWKRLQETSPPIFWTPYGGHWVVTRAEDIKTVQLDHERFSHSVFGLIQDGIGFKPLSLDPPEHTPYRAIIDPAFLPGAIRTMENKAREIAVHLIESLRPRGECEFMADFANILPMEIFLSMAGLPKSDRAMLITWVHSVTHDDVVDPAGCAASRRKLLNYIRDALERRRASPGEDLLSMVVEGEINGERLSHEDCMSVAYLLVLGGLDTVASMLGFVARTLALHPEPRRRIREDRKLMPKAIEELLRRHGLSNTVRNVTKDFDYKGVPFRKGDVVQQAAVLYGLDDTLFEHPMEIDLDRKMPIRHSAFGHGPHTCPGQILARREIKVFLEEWLSRIPDFCIKPGTTPKMKFEGLIAVNQLELAWNPNA